MEVAYGRFSFEVAREVNQLLHQVFAQRRKDGRTDLEAVETALRGALHQAGAAALTQLLRFEAVAPEERRLPCRCGHHAQFQEVRSKPLLTVVGPACLSRPYYWCAQCGTDQFPVDVELDIQNTEFSPGVRRMKALVGQQAPFDQGREEMKVLAGLEVTAKSVERTAEALGADMAQHEQAAIRQALQLDLPAMAGEPIPILYVQMDGTGIPVVKKETLGRPGIIVGQPAHTREVNLGCAFTQTTWDREGYPVRAPDSTTYTGAIETAEEFGRRLYREAWERGWSRALLRVVMGDGAEWIWNLAAQLYARGVPLRAVENALLLATSRRLFRPAQAPPLGRIRSLAYFLPVIDEVLDRTVSPGYFGYLRSKIAGLYSSAPNPPTSR